ncbi:MAG: Unknown protein [uncultured Sulfurovum sp.]|uniref:Uncharacterized protein n=1 Tax=uncultured Sulfurovum sp. TaxID=269237 RepID=A0A6S6SMA4_9BACT|nr:MAG: Unknown protein [uncultured Sulfurovum sp.]
MKNIKNIVAFAVLLTSVGFAQEVNSTKVVEVEKVTVPTKEVKKQTVVFDCSSADKKFIASRLWLIDISLQEYEDKKIPYDAVLTIHSGCTDILAPKEDKSTAKIEKMLNKISKHKNLSIEACQIAVDRFKIKHDDIYPFIKLVPNSITRVIALQNNGYAFIPFSK